MKIARFIPSKPAAVVLVFGALSAFTLGVTPGFAVEKTLQNDSFSGTGSVTCQTGFIQGEIAAARFAALPSDYPFRIEKVQVLVCPGSTQNDFVLKVWQDDGVSRDPGVLLHEEIYTLFGSDSALNEVDLALENIVINADSVRIGFEYFFSGPPPGFANDLGGHVVPQPNFIYAVSPIIRWFYADEVGVDGDWILRLVIETEVAPPIFSDGFESGDTSAWSTVAH
jgi:hypothetical protein